MPEERPQEVRRAGVRPFTPPGQGTRVDVSTPGLQKQAQPTRLEQLRAAMGLVGKGAASIAQGRAAIGGQLQALKQKAIADVERDQRIHAASIGAARAKAMKGRLMDILVEGEDKGTAWTEQRMRSEMANAGSEEEKMMYQQAWLSVKGALDAEDAQNAELENDKAQQSFNMSARTAITVVNKLEEQLGQDPDLKRQLVGNGYDISKRVQDWILTEAMTASPAAFDESQWEDLPEEIRKDMEDNKKRLVHQLTDQSYRIAGNLLTEWNTNLDKSNVSAGSIQIAADVSALLRGKQTFQQTEKQLSYTVARKLGSQNPQVARDTVKSAIRAEIGALSSGDQGIDDIDEALANLDAALDLKINGVPIFTDIEKASERQAAAVNVAKAAPALIDIEVARFKGENMVDMPNPDGTTTKRFDPAAMDDLALEYDKIEEKIHEVLSIDRSKMTANEAIISSVITQQVDRYRSSLSKGISNNLKDRMEYDTYIKGAGQYEARQVLAGSPFYQATHNAEQMTNEQLSQFKSQMYFTAKELKNDEYKAAIDAWDGTTVEYTKENLPLLLAMAATDAGLIALGFKNSSEVPASLTQHREKEWDTGDPIKQEVTARWYASLPAEVREAALVDTSPGLVAAMSYLTKVESLGIPSADIHNLGPKVDSNGMAVSDWDTTLNQAKEVAEYVDSDAGWGVINGELIPATVMTTRMMISALSELTGGFDLNEGAVKTVGDAKGALGMFFGPGASVDMLDDIFYLWQGVSVAHPGFTDSQKAYSVVGYIQKMGISLVSQNGRPVAIHDPRGVFGKVPGTKIEHHMTKANEYEFIPELKQAILESDWPGKVNTFNELFFLMDKDEGRIKSIVLEKGKTLADVLPGDEPSAGMVSVGWAGNVGALEDHIATSQFQGGGAALTHIIRFGNEDVTIQPQGWPADITFEKNGKVYSFKKGTPISYNQALLVPTPAADHSTLGGDERNPRPFG